MRNAIALAIILVFLIAVSIIVEEVAMEKDKACYITDVEGRQHACDLDKMDTKCLSILLAKLNK